ncbi:MAG: Ig-like domain-containing protein, partial [Terriglobia bacterium]
VLLCALLLFFRHSLQVHAQSSAAGSGAGGASLPASTPCCAGEAPREVDFPYYTLRDGYQSTLLLVSDSPHPIDLSIVIYGALGHSAIAPPYTIQPQQKLAIDMGRLLAKMGLDPTGEFGQGSVGVYFEGTIMPVVGQVTISNPAQRLIHESEMVENDPGRSDIPAILDGLWWGLGGGRDARIVVSNMTSQQVKADVYLDYAGVRHPSSLLLFAPHEQKTLSVTELLTALGTSPSEAPDGGITIIGHSLVPALIAQGRITDPVTGFSTTLRFPGAETQPSNALHASGVPIGTPSKESPFAGMGDFVPHLALRNLLVAPQQVTVTVEYPQPPSSGAAAPASPVAPVSSPAANAGSGGASSSSAPRNAWKVVNPPPPQPGDADDHPEWGPGTGSTVGTVTLAPITVAGQSTVDFSYAAVMNQLPLPLPFVSIRIQYSGQAGSMVAELASVDQRQDLVIDSKLMNEGWSWSGSGANPWHLDNQTESILFLTNESGQTARVGFMLTANGVHYYLTKLRLQPHETRVINLRSLRDAQAADFRQHQIPASASDGSVNWIRIDDVPVEGRLIVIDRHQGVASNYDCCTCPCGASLSYLTMDPSGSWGMVPNETMQCWCYANYTDCNENELPQDVTGAATWTSLNTAVATMDGTKKGEVHAVAKGSASIKAQYSGFTHTQEPPPPGHCVQNPVSPYCEATCNVQIPTFLLRLSSSCNPYTCGTGDGATQINELVYQVLDQNTSQIDMAGMTIAEHVIQTQTTCPPENYQDSSTWPTDPSGIMIGADYQRFCYPVGTNCFMTFSQTFTVTASGVPYPVQVRLSNGTVGSHNVIGFTFNNGVGSCPTCYPSP